jgi:ATPase subunit of ABC transporter with duplicated ATPase domains
MLFTGEEALKTANVLSGGEKVRCMLIKNDVGESELV